jgi:hypothetical protein
MKRLLALALLVVLFLPAPASAAFSVVNKASGAFTGASTGVTTGAVNMSGADFLVMVIAWYAGGTEPVPSDSSSNTWHALTSQQSGTGDNNTRIYYAWNATSSAAQTFTLSAVTNGYASFCVAGFSGSQTSSTPFDAQNGSTSNPSNVTSLMTRSTGVLAQATELVVTGLGLGSGSLDSTETADSGFTTYQTQAGASGAAFGTGLAYKIKNATTAENVTWSWPTTTDASAVIASFESATGGGGGGGTLHTLATTGVGQ